MNVSCKNTRNLPFKIEPNITKNELRLIFFPVLENWIRFY